MRTGSFATSLALIAAWWIVDVKVGAVPSSPPATIIPVVHIAPEAAGDRDGRDWANAGSIAELPSLAKPGSLVRLRADQGSYRIEQPIEVREGGSMDRPTIFEGVSVEGAPMRANLTGNRASPYDAQGASGPEVFRILAGANHIQFRNFSFRDQGYCFRFSGDVSDISVTDSDARNVRRFIENYHAGDTGTATVSGLVVRNIQIHGFSREAIRLQYDTHDVLIEDVLGDSERQDGDNFAEGIALDGTAHDVTIRRVTMRNIRDSTNLYWNGDGFSTELGNYGIRFEDTVAIGNTDAGYDLKSRDTTLIRAAASDNAVNFKLWGSGIMLQDCIGFAPSKRGGSGNQHQIEVVKGASVIVSGCRFVDNDPATITFSVDDAASLTVVDSKIVRHQQSKLSAVGNTGMIAFKP